MARRSFNVLEIIRDFEGDALNTSPDYRQLLEKIASAANEGQSALDIVNWLNGEKVEMTVKSAIKLCIQSSHLMNLTPQQQEQLDEVGFLIAEAARGNGIVTLSQKQYDATKAAVESSKFKQNGQDTPIYGNRVKIAVLKVVEEAEIIKEDSEAKKPRD
jgi:hypothetical protein